MGLGTSTSGNLSIRDNERILYSPTGTRLSELKPDSLASGDISGSFSEDIKPTKEWGMHLAVYQKFPDVNAVVHVHPVHTIAVTMRNRPGGFLPAATPQCVMRAGRVPIVPYAPPGSDKLHTDFAELMGEKAAALLNHGLFTYSSSFTKALGIMEEIEESCRIICLAGFKGRTLSEEEISDLIGRNM